MKNKRKPILIYAAIVIGLGLLIYAVPKVTDVFETTEVIQTGTLQVTEEVTCYFVREETVYEAGAAGTVKYLIDEGTHIRPGTVTAEFKEDESGGEPRSKYNEIIESVGSDAVRTVSFEAQSSGILSYYADGYENSLTPENLDEFKYSDAKEISDKTVELKHNDVRRNEPMFKICDNDNWYIVCWVESASIAKYQAGQDITFQFDDGSVDMTIESITEDGDRWKIVCWSNNYYESFTTSRVKDGVLISKNYEGLIVKNSCITTRKGKIGVMVLQKTGDYEFTRIKVIANDEEYSALADDTFTDQNGETVKTVQVYDEILKRPGKGT